MSKANVESAPVQDESIYPNFKVVLVDAEGVEQCQIGYRYCAPGANAVRDNWNCQADREFTAVVRPITEQPTPKQPTPKQPTPKASEVMEWPVSTIKIYWVEYEQDGIHRLFTESLDRDTAKEVARRYDALGYKPKVFVTKLRGADLVPGRKPVKFRRAVDVVPHVEVRA